MRKTRTQDSIVIYRDARGDVKLRADVRHETIWATQAQIAQLFGVRSQAITKHILNIYKENELQKGPTCSKMEQVQIEGGRSVMRRVDVYNLDMIIAAGYRVNSHRATQFRIWATRTLRDYIMKGYVLNAKRLKQSQATSVGELNRTLHFIQDTIQHRTLAQTEIDSLLSVIRDYTNAWLLLHKYDKGRLTVLRGKRREKEHLSYHIARPAIDTLQSALIKQGEAGDLFGYERDGAFQGVLQTIYQRFSGKELYPSVEEKAAHLLYFIIKDHVFSDGNKRIGSFLFILFLQKNQMLYRKNGEKKINDNALVALALLIAESNPREKENVIALITNLIQ